MTILNRIHRYKQSNRWWFQRPPQNITRITVHHDAIPNNGRLTDGECLDIIYRTHISTDLKRYRNWPGISYHFWVNKEGDIYQLNNFSDITWHDDVNSDSIAVCFNGYFHAPYNEKPTQRQLESLKWILDELCTKHPEFPADHDDVKGHRERTPTSCPGTFLFPYVKEYREKLGNVDWGITPPQPVIVTLDANKDIPSDVEDKLNLKSYDWYDKHWSLADLIKYTDELSKR